MICRSLDDVLVAADADSKDDPPLTQDTADLVVAILAPHRNDRDAA